MPFVNVKVAGTLTDEQKAELVKRFTQALVEVANKPPEYCFVVIEEIPRTDWGVGGKLLSER